jgi:transposase
VDAMTSDKTSTRRRYRADFKAQVLGECDAPGASVAKVAMSHGINTNVVHGWRKLAREAGGASPVSSHEFVPAMLPAAPMPPVVERGIEVELRRGAVTMKITWPSSATSDFATWTRELLR